MSVADWVVEVDVPQPSRGARANLARRIGIVASIVAVGALIVFAQRIGVGVIVAGAIAIGGTFLPGELPHVDTPDTFPRGAERQRANRDIANRNTNDEPLGRDHLEGRARSQIGAGLLSRPAADSGENPNTD